MLTVSDQGKHTSGRKPAATKKAEKSKKELLEIDRRWRALHADATSCDKPLSTRVVTDLKQDFEQERLRAVRSRLYRDLSTEETRKPTGIQLLEERLQQSADPSDRTGTTHRVAAPSRKPDGEVSKRRTIVRNHRGASREELCKVLDHESVSVPDPWRYAGVTKWEQARRDSKYRSKIDTIFSKDRR